jgi:hypothetical protein
MLLDAFSGMTAGRPSNSFYRTFGSGHCAPNALIDDHAHRRGLETVARVALLRAVRDRHE